MTFPKYLLQFSLSSCPAHGRVPRCTLACWPEVCYFQCGGWAGVGLYALLSPPFCIYFLSLEGDFSSSWRKEKSCCSSSAARTGRVVVHVLACTVVIVNFDVAVRGLRGGCLLLGVAVIYHALKTPPSSLGSGKGRGQMILV